MNCGELLVKLIEAHGIDTVFGIPGTHTVQLYKGLHQSNLKHITPRHEQGAGFMADGYARVSGKPAACFTVSGPGVLNILTAAGQALQDSVPMLIITTDNARHELNLGEGKLHETRDLAQVVAPLTRLTHVIQRPDELPQLMARAFAIFTSARPGPVCFILPQDVIVASADHVAIKSWAQPLACAANTKSIQVAAEAINSASKIVLALGGGAINAKSSAREFAQKTHAAVTCTSNAKGLFSSNDPQYLPSIPSHSAIKALYDSADLIVAVGTELGETDYDFYFTGQFHTNTPVIRIDLDSAQLCRQQPALCAIHADAEQALQVLNLAIAEKAPDNPFSQQIAQTRSQLKDSEHVGYQRLFDTILAAFPQAIVLGDSTQPSYYASAQFHPVEVRHFASSATGYGTLGYALPAAMGAKLARPNAPVIALSGDGGVQYTLNELACAREFSIPVISIIWHNQGYQQITREFEKANIEPIACDVYAPDFLQLASAYDCHAMHANNADELRQQLEWTKSLNDQKPIVIVIDEDRFLAG